MIRQPRNLAILLTLVVLWAPLPFASVTMVARTGLFLVIGLLVIASAWVLDPRPKWPPPVPLACVLMISVLGLLQSIPLPKNLVAAISSERLETAMRANELVAASGLEVTTELVPLSLAVGSTLQTSLFIAMMVAAASVAFVVGRRREHRRILLGAAIVAGLFQVIYGGGRFAGDSDRIWGRVIEGATGRFRGTFVNPDHFAFFLGLILPLVLAWGWWNFKRAHRIREPTAYLSLVGPPLLIWMMLFVGQALSGSRAGLVGAIVTVVAQGLLIGLRLKKWVLLPIGGVMAGVGVTVLAFISSEQGLGRLLQTSTYEIRWNARFDVYRASLDLVKDYYLTGSGLGTFREVFPSVQPPDLLGSWWHAHNDFLEILITGGLVATALVMVSLITMGSKLHGVWRRGERSEDQAAGLAALGVLLAASLHSVFDFGLTMPANALLLSVVLGAAAGAETKRHAIEQRLKLPITVRDSVSVEQ